MSQIVPGICRNCVAFCPILVTIEDGRLVGVAGDPGAREFEGYTCPKGRALPDQHNDPNRLLRSVKRQANGSFAPISSDKALAEIVEKVERIIACHGPRSVALYLGTGVVAQMTGAGIAAAWLRAIKSPMLFTVGAIDKPAAHISTALHGNWIAGAQSFESSDTWMIVGANPVISKSNGAPTNNPGQRLKEAQRRGLKLIVIDPRRTETARRAHVHLQARPGEDPTLLAGLINIIIREQMYDRDFTATHAQGFAALESEVAAFTPAYVAERAGVAVEDLLEAARTFGRAQRGSVVCSTGPSFSTHSNLTFYLALCLNTLCGRWTREGERAPMPNVLLPAYTPKAQPYPPYPPIDESEPLRVHGLTKNTSGMPTAALPDEILLEGPGQVKALFCIGGNPMMAIPDQIKTKAAFEALELLVVFDYQMTATADLADYVIATPLSLEVPALTHLPESLKYLGVTRGYEMPWAHYAPKLVDPPPGSDVIEEREFFFRMAQMMNLKLDWVNFFGWGAHIESETEIVPLDMKRVPSVDELFEIMCARARVPLSEVKKHPHGHCFSEIDVVVAPRDADCQARLELADPTMMAELRAVWTEDISDSAEWQSYPLRLVSRRANNFINSVGPRMPVLNRHKAHNPLFIHPEDLAALALEAGDVVRVRSSRASILAVAEVDGSLRRGVVAMTHGFGGNPSEPAEDPRTVGSPVTRLVSMAEPDPISGIPRMSAVPVRVEAFG